MRIVAAITILLFHITAVSLAGSKDKAQQSFKEVSGKVVDVNGNEIAGAQITIAETNETFLTDLDGNFHFKVKTDRVYTVRVNSIGFQPSQTQSASLGNFSELCLTQL